MSQAATLRSSPPAVPGVHLPLVVLFAVVVASALAGALVTMLFEQVKAPEIANPPVSFLSMPVPPQGDTSVPDASSVFAGREMVIEEPVPTF